MRVQPIDEVLTTIQVTVLPFLWCSRAFTETPTRQRTHSPLLRPVDSNCAWRITLGYSSDFNFQMNLGGALGDLNWLDEGDVPMVSFQCPHDPFGPYDTTAVLVVLDHQRAPCGREWCV